VLFFQVLFQTPLLLTALLAGLAASVVSGVIGSYVVVKRIVFISGSIAHSVLAGIGISIWLERVHNLHWLSPIYGALVAAVLSALTIGWIHLHWREREDSVIAVLWSIGMAVGVIFLALTPGYGGDLSNFLIGNILWVDTADLQLLIALDVVVIAVVIPLHKRFLLLCFDEEQALLQGVPVNSLYLLLLVLIAISVVLLMQVVGIILVITMLTIPPALANMVTKRLSHMMFIGVIFSAIFCFTGTAVAFHLDWPMGAAIALVAGASYLLALPLSNAVSD